MLHGGVSSGWFPKADFESEKYMRLRFLSRLIKSRALAGNVCSPRERSALGCG
jgi:hypothetical protein